MRGLVEHLNKLWRALFLSSGFWLVSFQPTGTSGKQKSEEDRSFSLGKLLGRAEIAYEFGRKKRFKRTMAEVGSLINELEPDTPQRERFVGRVEDFLVQTRGKQHANKWVKNLSTPNKKNP